LHKWLIRRLQPSEVHVCLEATGRYSVAAAEILLKLGYTVSVMNPGRIKKFGESQLQRNKTDKLDAVLIAEYCQRMQPPPWQPPTLEVRETF
jgi:transposase